MSSVINMKLISSLEKLYDSDKMPSQQLERFSMLRNEKKSFQLAIEASDEADVKIDVCCDFERIKIYTVEHVRSDLPMHPKDVDDYYRFSESGYYPDLLLPVENSVHLKKGINTVWFEIYGGDGKIGENSLSVRVDGSSAELTVEIIDADLDFGDFVYTNWFHSDCLMSYYNFEAFSDEYWRVVANYLKTAAEYGMNCVLTPLFTPPLDTEKGKERPTVQLVDVRCDKGQYSFSFDKLTRWIDTAEKCGIKYFEMSHLYTQWGARSAPKIMATVDGEYKRIFGWETDASSREYKKFLLAFSTELKKYFAERNLKDRVMIHVSDEPNIWMLRLYRKASGYIHKIFDGYKIMDALSDYWFYKLKIVSNPIPANDHIDKFLGNVDNLWTYYCSGQNNHYVSNRFFCNESLRTRVIGYQLYKFNIKGFLQWGYNFYYSQLSKSLIDPFKVTDAGGKFPSGDSFVVYPAPDGTAYHSIRLKVFYDALQDMAALNTLEKLADKKACLDIIEEGGKTDITFRNYPHDNNWLLSTREAVNECIKKSLS